MIRTIGVFWNFLQQHRPRKWHASSSRLFWRVRFPIGCDSNDSNTFGALAAKSNLPGSAKRPLKSKWPDPHPATLTPLNLGFESETVTSVRRLLFLFLILPRRRRLLFRRRRLALLHFLLLLLVFLLHLLRLLLMFLFHLLLTRSVILLGGLLVLPFLLLLEPFVFLVLFLNHLLLLLLIFLIRVGLSLRRSMLRHLMGGRPIRIIRFRS